MCLLCVAGVDAAGEEVHRLRLLRLLALVEYPDALPPDVAIRLSRDILAALGSAAATFRCDAVLPSGARGERL